MGNFSTIVQEVAFESNTLEVKYENGDRFLFKPVRLLTRYRSSSQAIPSDTITVFDELGKSYDLKGGYTAEIDGSVFADYTALNTFLSDAIKAVNA